MANETSILNAEELTQFLTAGEPQKEIKTADDLFDTPKEEETPKEEVKVEEPIKEEPRQEEVQAPKGSDYSELVKSLVETGDWESYDIEIEEGKFVDISELDSVDKELFLELKRAQEEEKKAKIKETHINIEGVDDYTKKLIEISKEGGDISQLIQTQTNYINPVLRIKETREEKDLIDLVAFKMQNQGLDSDVIEFKIKKIIKDGTLDEEADKVIDEIETNYNNHLEQTKQQILDSKLQIEKQRKDYKKTISEKVKPFNLKEHDSRSIIELASKYDEQGVAEVDKLFYKIKQEDPERFLEVVMLLKDRELFESVKFTKIKNQSTLETTRRVLSVKPRSTTTEKTPEKKENAVDQLFKQEQPFLK